MPAVVIAQGDPRISPLRSEPTDMTLSQISTPILYYCKNPPGEAETDARVDRAGGRSNRPRSASPFFDAEILNIELDTAGGQCDAVCRAALTQALIQSLALWRSGCARCEAQRLLAIAINGGVWLDSVTIDKWRWAIRANAKHATFDPNAIRRMSLRPFGRQPIVNFRRVQVGESEYLCTAARRYASGRDLADAVCAGELRRCRYGQCLILPVRVGHAQSCELLGRIACGSADGELALNTTDFRYHYQLTTLDGSQAVSFGRGRQSVELLPVLMHESGHWFGLMHEKESDAVVRASIMRDHYDSQTPWCVTEWNLAQLDNAVDMEWDYRLSGSHGLVFRR